VPNRSEFATASRQELSFDVLVDPFCLTLAMALSIAALEGYIWIEPVVSPLAALRTKNGCLAADCLRV